MYAGLAVLWSLMWALILLPLVLLFIDRRVIVPEEQYLLRRFGTDYKEYKSRVRRWIGPKRDQGLTDPSKKTARTGISLPPKC